jgi:hypothetical protein
VNIGYSCRLLTDEMEEVFTVDGESHDTVLDQLTRAKNIMSGAEKTPLDIDSGLSTVTAVEGAGTAVGRSVDLITYNNGNLTMLPSTKNGTTARLCVTEESSRYALIIGGQSLVSSVVFSSIFRNHRWVEKHVHM